MIHIVDDFLTQLEYNRMLDTFLFSEFPWQYNEYKVGEDDQTLENFQFVHSFYKISSHYGGVVHNQSTYFEHLLPILSRIEYIGLHKIKANLQPLFKEAFKSDFHTDYSDDHGLCGHMTTGIYYLNSCNGYTEFENGQKVDCLANRWVTFPSNWQHRGVSQTDMRVKLLLNFNYFTPHLNNSGEAEKNSDK
tara:strand:+ start:231 stop:803 length:573 start_codon:yes stop_codon:yes gene_type:complete